MSHRADPWLAIPAADYEGHMSAEHVGQLAALSSLFRDTWERLRPARLAVLGCATGNGLEHVDPAVTRRIVGVDVSPEYLELARDRYGAAQPGLELRCARVEDCAFEAGSFDLVSVALLLEYVEPASVIALAARWLAPGGTLAVVVQMPSAAGGAGLVSETPFASLRALAPAMRLVPPEVVEKAAAAAGLRRTRAAMVPLPGGKSFHASEHVR